MPKVTKTLNPLHFEDLEPHRFEDLVRQLIYDFRPWRSLEAIGRTGSDEGIDIRGIELVGINETDFNEEHSEEENDQVSERDAEAAERVWIIQCKREKSIGPQKVRAIVSGFLSSAEEIPYGYILAAACDFSKAARDAFRDELRKYGVQEFYIWGKAEIEDQLFLPKNDHLLFAYFGISLQVKRRSTKMQLRSRLALKRKLVKQLGAINQHGYHDVLIRDPHNEKYPYIDSQEEFIKNPLWRYWQFYAHQPPDHIAFIGLKHYAYVNWQTKEWDVLPDYDNGIPFQHELFGLDSGCWDPHKKGEIYNAYWQRNVPPENRAWVITLRTIHYDRILALDEIGDSYNEGLHLLVDYSRYGEPFEPAFLRFLQSDQPYWSTTMSPEEGSRISFFPKEIPDERELVS